MSGWPCSCIWQGNPIALLVLDDHLCHHHHPQARAQALTERQAMPIPDTLHELEAIERERATYREAMAALHQLLQSDPTLRPPMVAGIYVSAGRAHLRLLVADREQLNLWAAQLIELGDVRQQTRDKHSSWVQQAGRVKGWTITAHITCTVPS